MSDGAAMVDHLLTRPVVAMDLHPPVCVGPDIRVRDAVDSLREHGQGAVLILSEDGELVGLFTERDLLYLVHEGEPTYGERAISAYMRVRPTTIGPGETIAEAISKMDRGGFRYLPIIDPDRGPIGIVSIKDILAHLVDVFPETFVNLPPVPR
jgi:CBS domain-containing protein